MNLFILLTSSLILCVGCATSNTGGFIEPNPNTFYKRNLKVKVNGEKYRGLGVLPSKEKYYFEIEPEANTEYMKLITCHRYEVIDNPPKKIRFYFYPNGPELDGACPIDIHLYDDKKKHQWAYLDFRRDETLEATINCNGIQYGQNGVGLCQSREGLFQRITFDESVKWASNCMDFDSYYKDQSFEFSMPRGKCQTVFKNARGEYFRFVTLGHEDIIQGTE